MTACELVDEVDGEDRFVRRTTRSRVRRENLWHRCAWIFVANSAGELYIHQRTTTKDLYPGFWDVAAGGVLGAAETYDAAASRELREELGIERAPGESIAGVSFADDTNRVIGRAYVCRFDGIPRLQASEVVRGEWVTAEQLRALVLVRCFCPDGLAALAAVLEHGEIVTNPAARDQLRIALQSARPQI